MITKSAITLALLCSMATQAMAQDNPGFALLAGAWKTDATTTLRFKDGSPDKSVGQSSVSMCYTPAFLGSDPFFGERPDMSKAVASGKARSCRFWPVQASKSPTKAERTVKFECVLTTGHRVWAIAQTSGTPTTMRSELRVFRQGGLGHVVVSTQSQRVGEACTPELMAPTAPDVSATPLASSVGQPPVTLGNHTYYFDGVESEDDVVHNNYYRLEESRTDWDREFSVSHYPALTSAAKLLAYLNEDNPSEGLVPGTTVKVLGRSTNGRSLSIEIMRRLEHPKDKPRFLYQVLHAVVEEEAPGMKAYRLQVDMAGTPKEREQSIAQLRSAALAELSRLKLPVHPK